jgi:hypothetical protein
MSTTLAESSNASLASYNDNMMMDVPAMKHMMEVANFMAGATMTLPQPYQKNPANCLAVVMQAAQWKMNPFAVAQKTHFVNGNIGYEAQLVSAVIQQSGVVNGMFEFEWFGDWQNVIGKFKELESKSKTDDYGRPKKYKVPAWEFKDEEGLGIRVSATLKGETEPRVLELLLTQATTRNSTLWADDPKQQIAYLAQKRWARLYCPGVILGVYSTDELETIPAEKDVTPSTPEPNPDPVYYTDEEFIANETEWRKVINKGKDPIKFIAFVQSKGKHFTENQKEEIMLWAVKEKAPAVVEGEATKVDESFTAAYEQAESEGKQ